eukprot:381196-Rhodomonas_salina.2
MSPRGRHSVHAELDAAAHVPLEPIAGRAEKGGGSSELEPRLPRVPHHLQPHLPLRAAAALRVQKVALRIIQGAIHAMILAVRVGVVVAVRVGIVALRVVGLLQGQEEHSTASLLAAMRPITPHVAR